MMTMLQRVQQGRPDQEDATLPRGRAAARDADGSALSRQEIRDEIATFLVAGHETTAMALTWSLALLSAYPQARQRLEDEVDAVLGDGPADTDKLPWTTAIISEAMRLYPPAWTLERTAVADDDVRGTRVPAGSMVAVLPYLIHRNPPCGPTRQASIRPVSCLARHNGTVTPGSRSVAGSAAASAPVSPGRRQCWYWHGCAATTGSS
jgi:cytochrome P450